MVTLSFVFAIFAISGIFLMWQSKDEYFKKLGLYLFLLGFVLFALQLQIDYPSTMEQQDSTGVLLLSIALLMLVLLFDILVVLGRVMEWLRKRG